jgi:2-keto-3-deoxy-L-rhamnonate aldolase
MSLAPGIYTPAPTFFKTDNHTIDFESQVAHAKFLQKNGIKGIVLLGSTGENAHLTRDERFQLVKTVHDQVPSFPILAGIASNALEDALIEIENAKKAGASHSLVLSSSYFGAATTQAGIFDYFTAVADKSVLPVLLYVYPGVTNNLRSTRNHYQTLTTPECRRYQTFAW